ncbi:MAG: hypothetical protein ABJO66_05435 [Parvibaculum sp.]|uniref:hypothetical protein n=1 Tax=Alphaproteobacteria TaxID=28211 RepID=UPI0032982C70
MTRRQDSFEYLSRYEGKDSWFWKLSLLAAADWTGDGKVVLLDSCEDDNLGRGTYNTISLLLLGAESSDTPITAMHVEDWLFKGREAVLRMLK